MMKTALFRALACCAMMLAALAAPVDRARAREQAAQLREVSVSEEGAETIVRIDLSAPRAARTFFLDGPARLVVDLPDAELGASAPEAAGLAKRIRLAPRDNGAVRVVVDLKEPAKLSPPNGEAGRKIVLRLSPFAQEAKRAEPTPPRGKAKNQRAAAAPEPEPSVPVPPRGARANPQRTIVVDAGHGGRDPGAAGVYGLKEKQVVLAAALTLKDALQKRGYHVVLTRDDDTYLPLQDRVRVARDHRADLFLSLHADSHSGAGARGASVYTLSESGGRRARSVMDQQDWDMDLGDAPRSGMVQQILLDLAQRETTNRSADFAQLLIRELGETTPLLRNTHRSAGFFVLLAPDVPAVLVELGFLTNESDKQRLADPKRRRGMMISIADAVDAFFSDPRVLTHRRRP
jgi:N-acetylmuramoyl-L-alanine amidase